MVRYLGSRLVRLVLSLIAVSLITFGLLQIVPGSFRELADMNIGSGLGDTGSVEADALAFREVEEEPPWEQYFGFMKGAVTGDMGQSFKYPQLSVEEVIAQGFPVSLTLATLAIILTLIVAVPLGLLAAVKKDKFADYGSMFSLTTLTALPGYLAALVLILIFASWLGLLPTGGWDGPEDVVIPVIALAIQPAATLARHVRTSVLESLREEYVVAAYAKGGTKKTVLTRHVLRNSLIPLVTVVGPLFANLATGTVLIEAMMGIPGLGLFFTVAARTRDVPLMMGTTLFFALLLMVMNLLVDLSYRILDPRIRYMGYGAARRKLRTVGTDPAHV